MNRDNGFTSMPCPICNMNGTSARFVSKERIRAALGKLFLSPVPASVAIADANIMRCSQCDLEWSASMEEGGAAFYGWITKQPGYYTEDRWEWNIVLSALKDIQAKSVLEIGCGSGKFLNLSKQEGIHVIGIDPTKAVVEECTNSGLEAYACTLEQFANNQAQASSFDAIVSFHTLEHIKNPLDFLSLQLHLLKPDGRLYASTPYTANASKEYWYDILNFPPHHLTRWNKHAYQSIAKQIGASVELYMPPSENVLQRTLLALHHRWFGPRQAVHRVSLLKRMALRPLSVVNEIGNQIRRELIDVASTPEATSHIQAANYVVLAVFSKHDNPLF